MTTNVERGLRFRRNHPLFTVHCNIIQRCCNPKNPAYCNYGGRGISVCEQWRASGGFRNFELWVTENLGPRPAAHTLDRIDNDGNYEPGNLRWATWTQQIHNRRCTALRAMLRP